MKKAVISLLVLSALSFGSATTIDIPDLPQYQEINASEAKQAYNNNSDQVPEAASFLIGEQDVNVNLEKENSSTQLKAEMDGKRLEELEKGEWENPDLKINATSEALGEIASGEPRKKIKENMDSGEIEVRANGLLNQIKVSVLKGLI